MPIDPLVREALITAQSEGKTGLATYFPAQGQYFLTFTTVPGEGIDISNPLEVAYVGVPVDHQYVVTGGIGPYEFVIDRGSLPPGLSMAADGNITGTPTTAGDYAWRVRVYDATGRSDSMDQGLDLVEGIDGPVFEVGYPGTWLYGPVAQNGAAGGSEAFYLKASTPEGLFSATPIAIPSGMDSLQRISVAGGAVFFQGNSGSRVSFDNGLTWTATSETLSVSYPVRWNGAYYWCGLRRSADGIAWEAVPNIGVNAVAILMARDSDGAVAYSSTDRTIYVSMDNAATWTLKRTSIWEVSHGMSATNGSRIWWTEDSTRGLYTDNLFENANNTYGTASQEYTPYYGGGFVITKANSRLIRTPEDSAVGVIVQDPFLYGARNGQNIAYGGGGLWAAEYSTNNASAPRQRAIWVSSDFGETWAPLGFTLYGDGGNLVYAGPTV